jgi:hypothetical protein
VPSLYDTAPEALFQRDPKPEDTPKKELRRECYVARRNRSLPLEYKEDELWIGLFINACPLLSHFRPWLDNVWQGELDYSEEALLVLAVALGPYRVSSLIECVNVNPALYKILSDVWPQEVELARAKFLGLSIEEYRCEKALYADYGVAL